MLPVELCGALRRRVDEASVPPARVTETLRRVALDRAYWTLIEVGPDVLAAAETLVASHRLRTLEAIHVASAQLFARRLPSPTLIFVSADQRQTAAAAAIGLTVRLVGS